MASNSGRLLGLWRFGVVNRRLSSSYDVVITGGGMVGTAFACSCGASSSVGNKKVLLLEAGDPPIIDKPPEQYSNRVSAINPSSRKLFQELGAWDSIANARAKLVKELKVYESCSSARINFAQPSEQTEVAHIIENNLIVSSLLKKLRSDFTNVEVCNKSAVKNCRLPDDLSEPVKIELSDGRKIETDLVVGADGYGSIVRKSMGQQYVAWEYGQKAVVATLQLDECGENSSAWQRFHPNGPIAILPLNERMSSLVWSTTPQEAERLCNLNEDQFVDELNAAMWDDSNLDGFANQALFFYQSLWNTICPTVDVAKGGWESPAAVI